MRNCEVRELGRISYGEALQLQRSIVERRKQGIIGDQLLLLEHTHVITLGRNAKEKNLLAGQELLTRAGIDLHVTDRGGDVTYHGPGQLVGYPILDLREWKRDVVAYVRALEQVIIDTLSTFGLPAGRVNGLTGVWIEGRKIAAIGVHLSRWVTSHGFALNINTDLSYFQYIVPCGLSLPVTSMQQMGVSTTLAEVSGRLAGCFGRVFACEVAPAAFAMEES
jgi:lipoyl(octanoyl) transferase